MEGNRYRQLTASVSWSQEKAGAVLLSESATILASRPVAGESFCGGGTLCTDCGMTEFPCRCCLECGRVQSRVMEEHERCTDCQEEAHRGFEPDSNRTLGLGGGW